VHATGTPTFFINGRVVTGAQPIETFRSIIDEEIAHADDLVASGVAQKNVYDEVLKEARQNPAPTALLEPEEDPYTPDSIGVGGLQMMGNARASHSIVLFTDLECPFCARLDAQLRGFVSSHPDVKVVVRQRPLPMHQHARTWARAAIAADVQGKTALFMEKAFAEKDRSDATLDKVAGESGLDVDRLHRDMESAATAELLRADEALGDKLNARGTPTSFVDGQRVIGAQPVAAFEDALKRAATRR
jgi:protein-disulfide isomerase